MSHSRKICVVCSERLGRFFSRGWDCDVQRSAAQSKIREALGTREVPALVAVLTRTLAGECEDRVPALAATRTGRPIDAGARCIVTLAATSACLVPRPIAPGCTAHGDRKVAMCQTLPCASFVNRHRLT